MTNFLLGLMAGLLGLVVFVVFILLAVFGGGPEEPALLWAKIIAYLGLILMLAGPIYFWAVRPILNRRHATKEGK